MSRTPARPALLTALATALAAALVLLAGGSAQPGGPLASHGPAPKPAAGSDGRDPRLTRPLFVDPGTQAAEAARSDARFRPLASRASAHWLVGTRGQTAASGRTAARSYAGRAEAAGRTPVVSVYGIPARDCGGQSGGGLTPQTYRAWVGGVAEGLRGSEAIVVLEPDALAMAGACPGQGARAWLLSAAAKRLTAAGAWVYLDAGHGRWHRPAEAARRLVAAGVRHARGFSTNVSNFGWTGAEERYVGAVRRELARRGVTGTRAVIDVSRSGAGPAADGAWCNPPHARLGAGPRVVARAGVDARLWVKPPGESDGSCGGGPAAGRWWPEGALQLLR